MDEPIYEQDRLLFEMREEMSRDFEIFRCEWPTNNL